jgi:hypothetical protein
VAAIQEIVWLSLLLFLFLGSLAGLGLGIGLFVRTDSTLRLCRSMNKWVSSRAALKPVEIPRTVGANIPEAKKRVVAGVVFLLGGLYASVQLAGVKSPGAILFGTTKWAVIYAILFDSLRWFVLIGCLAAVVIGVMLLFFPAAWRRFEAWGNRWLSTRRAVAGGDAMHFPLERWVESSPRSAGGILTALSVVSLLAFGVLIALRLKLGLV